MSVSWAVAFAFFVTGAGLAWSGPARRVARVRTGRAAAQQMAGAVPDLANSVRGVLSAPRNGHRVIGHRAGKRADAASGDSVPLLLELLGVMLQAGLGLPRALEVAARVADGPAEALARAAAALQLGTDWAHAWPEAPPSSDVGQLRDALHFAASTGASSAELLYARARQLRRSRHRDLERRAAALGVRLVIPLGVCSLPAFLCLGVIPILLAMIPGG